MFPGVMCTSWKLAMLIPQTVQCWGSQCNQKDVSALALVGVSAFLGVDVGVIFVPTIATRPFHSYCHSGREAIQINNFKKSLMRSL